MNVKLRGTPPNGDLFQGSCPNCGSALDGHRSELKIVLQTVPLLPGVRTVDYDNREVFARFEVGQCKCPVCGLHAVDLRPVKAAET